MQNIKDIPTIVDEEGTKWFHAKKSFALFALSWSGIRSIYSKGIDKEFFVDITDCGKKTIYISHVGLFKISAHGTNRFAKEYFKKVVDSYFLNFSPDEI